MSSLDGVGSLNFFMNYWTSLSVSTSSSLFSAGNGNAHVL